MAKAIWSSEDSNVEGLPGEKTLRHWVYLRMPEERAGIAERWFREKWMSAVAMQFWLYFAGKGMGRRPPTDLIREVAVSTR